MSAALCNLIFLTTFELKVYALGSNVKLYGSFYIMDYTKSLIIRFLLKL